MKNRSRGSSHGKAVKRGQLRALIKRGGRFEIIAYGKRGFVLVDNESCEPFVPVYATKEEAEAAMHAAGI